MAASSFKPNAARSGIKGRASGASLHGDAEAVRMGNDVSSSYAACDP